VTKKNDIKAFNFPPGKIINGKYEIVEKLGGGLEGEVYKIRETSTDIIQAAKFFLPSRNANNIAAKRYAKKLHKLRSCSIIIHYVTQDKIHFKGEQVFFLVSEYVEGGTLDAFLKKQPGKRLPPFQAVLMLHSLVKGLEEVHGLKEYHGDLHTENIIVQRYGLGFDLKLLDFYHWGSPRSEDFRYDLVEAIRVFYDVLGGAKYYKKQPQQIKDIIMGMKKSLIIKKFKNLSVLRVYLENINWEQT
jgi:tRNA A-37 threonylcarbamoyl transferase component Bud32